jgi:hypothetical protein
MPFIPGKSRTKVVKEGDLFQARYFDTHLLLWFDLGDPRDTRDEAQALIKQFHKGEA